MSDLSNFILFKRKNGIYYIRYNENGKRRWKSTGAFTKSDALNILPYPWRRRKCKIYTKAVI